MGIDIRKINIFVEGKADRVFFRDLLKVFYGIYLNDSQLKETVFVCESYNNLKLHKDEFLKVNAGGKKEGGINIVFFDADFTGQAENHGFYGKSEYLNSVKQTLNIQFDYYLLPDNNSDGTLENLLETCIPIQQHSLMQCWNSLEECVSSGNYNIPASKSKIYFYLECLHGNTAKEKDKIKDANRDFTNAHLWVLDYVNNDKVKSLKEFLDIYLL